MEAYLALKQLVAKWCMLLEVMHTAVYYIMLLLARPLRLRSEHIVLSQGWLSVIASSISWNEHLSRRRLKGIRPHE